MFRKLSGQSLKSFAWDVSAIVIGLTITFLIDEWRSERNLHREEMSILESIREELEADVKMAEGKIELLIEREKNKEKLLDHKTFDDPVSLSTVINQQLLSYQGFFPHNNTYESISAELRNSISSDHLRTNLQSYYSKYYGWYQDWADYDKQLAIERLQFLRTKILIDTVNTVDFSRMSLEEIRESNLRPGFNWNGKYFFDEAVRYEFRNHIYWSIHTDNVTMYYTVHKIEKARELIQEIAGILEEKM